MMARLAACFVGLLLFSIASIALWQTLSLQTWTFAGPGPGLFPQALSILCVVLCLAEIVAPTPATSLMHELESEDGEPSGRGERRTFGVYAAGLILLTLGAFQAGFAVTTFLVIVLILRFGEGINLFRASLVGIAYVIVGWIAFAWLLRVNLPIGPIDRAFLSLVY